MIIDHDHIMMIADAYLIVYLIILSSNSELMQLFTARCTLDGKLQSAVLRSHVVRLSVCASVMLADCDLIGWKSSEIISPLVSPRCSLVSADPNIRGLLQGNFGPK